MNRFPSGKTRKTRRKLFFIYFSGIQIKREASFYNIASAGVCWWLAKWRRELRTRKYFHEKKLRWKLIQLISKWKSQNFKLYYYIVIVHRFAGIFDISSSWENSMGYYRSKNLKMLRFSRSSRVVVWPIWPNELHRESKYIAGGRNWYFTELYVH